MDAITRKHLENLKTSDKESRRQSFLKLIEMTDEPVDWAYDVWDEMLEYLHHKDNHMRAIATQILCNLARSDPEKRMLKDLEAILNVTHDERFVTARHTLQALWKIGTAGEAQRQLVVDGLSRRFADCIAEKNYTLIRFDIIVGLNNLFEAVNGESVKETALMLIETEEDPKYRKKYAKVWKVT